METRGATPDLARPKNAWKERHSGAARSLWKTRSDRIVSVECQSFLLWGGARKRLRIGSRVRCRPSRRSGRRSVATPPRLLRPRSSPRAPQSCRCRLHQRPVRLVAVLPCDIAALRPAGHALRSNAASSKAPTHTPGSSLPGGTARVKRCERRLLGWTPGTRSGSGICGSGSTRLRCSPRSARAAGWARSATAGWGSERRCWTAGVTPSASGQRGIHAIVPSARSPVH
jgi:hypothetical protein